MISDSINGADDHLSSTLMNDSIDDQPRQNDSSLMFLGDNRF
jgi:hypothetical protein